MPISDLTGTIWVINSSPNISSSFDYSINFELPNGNSYSGFKTSNTPALLYDYDEDFDVAYRPSTGGWTAQSWRIITISNGSDVSNASLITWLTNNATQVSVSDLTGTEWIFNENPTFPSADKRYNINFSSNSLTFNCLQTAFDEPTGSAEYTMWYFTSNETPSYGYTGIVYSNMGSYVLEDSNYYSTYGITNYWINGFKTISITGGTDTSNPDLIVWLTNNATLQQPQPTQNNKISFGNLNISKMYLGSTEITKMFFGSTEIYGGSGGDTPSGILGTWIFNNTIDITDMLDSTIDINFTCNNVSYTSMQFSSEYDGDVWLYFVYYGNTMVYGSTSATGSLLDANYKTITITGGTDVENATFIAWLEANATKQ